MPEYNYDGCRCGPQRIVQSIKSDPLKVCLKCKEPIKRVLSDNVNFEIKGFSEKNKYSKDK